MGSKPSDIEAWLSRLGNPAADRDYRPGHERMLALLETIDSRRPRLRIRIAGTNGKGSTAFMLAAALQSAGLKVGLYTSPHILVFNERIRIDGTPVDDAALLHGLERLMPAALEIGASYFETATALALDQFSRAQVDVEILEAGVGARLDATTAIAADLALITPIALDHQNWLGDSLSEIASEKAWIMNGCEMAISAPQCDAVYSELLAFRPDLRSVSADDFSAPLAMAGEHQRVNAALAWGALNLLADRFDEIDSERGKGAISHCTVSGRLQQMHLGGAELWLDAGHNRHAIEALLPWLQSQPEPFDAILIFTREDRSLADAISLLAPFARQLIGNHDQPDLSPEAAVEGMLRAYPAGRLLLLGSFTTVAAIRRRFASNEYGKPMRVKQ